MSNLLNADRRRILGTAAGLALITIGASSARAMTVEEAYAAIPHKRTVFDPSRSRLPAAHARSLDALFRLTDAAVVLRVMGLRAVKAGASAPLRTILTDYGATVARIAALDTPAEVGPPRDLIVLAVKQHRQFFEARMGANGVIARRDVAFGPEVQAASARLRQAYDLLMRTFPREPDHNRTAFFDHLCALDFI